MLPYLHQHPPPHLLSDPALGMRSGMAFRPGKRIHREPQKNRPENQSFGTCPGPHPVKAAAQMPDCQV